jgi:hypothetical protein
MQENEGRPVNELAALGTAVPQALVEGVTDRLLLGMGRVFGVGTNTIRASVVPRIAAGIGMGAATEVPAEVLQQALERAQAGLDLFSPDAFKEYKESAIAAGVLGGGIGGVTGAVRGQRPEAPPPRGEDLALRQALEELRAEYGPDAAITPEQVAVRAEENNQPAGTPAPQTQTAPVAPEAATTPAPAPQEVIPPEVTAAVEKPAEAPIATDGTTTPAAPVEAAVAPPVAPTAPSVPRPIATFRTAQGSTYDIDENGQTTRLKMSAGRGQGEVHPPHNAMFVRPDQKDLIMDAMRGMGKYRLGSISPDGRFIPIKPGQTIADLGDNEPAVGIYKSKDDSEPESVLPALTTPAVGLHPVEHVYGKTNKNGSVDSMRHVGNAIVDVRENNEGSSGQQPSARTIDPEEAKQRLSSEPTVEPVAAEAEPVEGAAETGPVEAAPAEVEQPALDEGQRQVQEESRKLVADRLDALRKRGKQGEQIAAGLEAAIAKREFEPQQLYEAFRAGDIMAGLLPQGANHQINFINSLGAGIQGERVAPKAEGMNGIIELSLAENQLPMLRETAAHEAFHVLQDYYAKYDPEFAKILARDFKKGMKVNELPENIQKALNSHKIPDSDQTYFEFLMDTPYAKDMPVSEIQAYVFGSLLDMSKRGIPITTVQPAYRRFINFLKSFFKKMGGDIKAEGPDSLSALQKVVRGETKKFDSEVSPVGQGEVQQSARQLETPEFKRWFGDSKVVEAGGRPLVVYHGTSRDKDFDAFKVGPRGAWFTTDPFSASGYAEENDSGYKVVDYHPKTGFVKKDISARVIPAYLSIQNPAKLSELQYRKISTANNYAKAQAEVFSELKSLGYDGIDYGHGIWIALEGSSQIKSAVGNRGTFNPSDKRMQFSARQQAARATGATGGLPPVGQRGLKPLTKNSVMNEKLDVFYAAFPNRLKNGFVGKLIGKDRTDDLFIKLQDKMLPVAQMIDDIKRRGGKITVAMDAYLKQDLMSGKIAVGIEERTNRLYKPMLQKIKDLGLSYKDVETYLHARHARERNARMAQINPTLTGPGSGMSDKAAAGHMKLFTDQGKVGKLQQVAKLFDAIIEDTRRTRVGAGLTLDFESATDEKGNPYPNYQYYAPLRRYGDENIFSDEGIEDIRKKVGESLAGDRARSGAGVGARGREDQRAFGSEKGVMAIIGHAMLQNSEAVIRSEKNAVGIAFLDMIEGLKKQNIDQDYAEVISKTPMKRALVNGIVKAVPDPFYKNEPDVLVVKRDGKEIAIRINDDRLAKALTGASGLKGDDANSLVKALGWMNQKLTMLNTTLNPEFLISNFVKDIQTAAINLQQHQVKGLTSKIMGDVRASIAGVHTVLRGGKANEFSKSFEEFRKFGGTTEFYGLVDLESKLKLIEELNNQAAAGKGWKAPLQLVKKTGQFIEDYNSMVENGVRLSTFHNLRKMGVSPEKAAQVAKNLTTNFSRGGEKKVLMNSLYLFYNASIQGSMGIANAIVRSPRVRKIVAGIMVAGVMSEFINAAVSGDDDDGQKTYDKIPKYVLEHNFVLMDPFGLTERGYLQIPMPYGFNGFWNLGRALAHHGRGQSTVGQTASSALITLIEGFNPVGGTQSFISMMAPTFADPFVDLTVNKDFAGRPIVPERGGFGPQPPQSQLYWNNTAAPYVAISQFLNEVTGGTPVIPGDVDISPNVLKYLMNYVTGATGAFVERAGSLAFNTIPSAIRGDLESLDVREIPFVRKFAGNVTERNSLEQYVEATNDVQRVHREVLDAQRFGEVERIQAAYERYPGQLTIAPSIEQLMRQRGEVNRQIRTLDRMEMPEDQKKETLKQLREVNNMLVGQVNSLYNQYVRNPQ